MIPLLLIAGAQMAQSALAQTAAVKQSITESNDRNKGIIEQNLQTQIRAAYRSGLTRLGLAQQQRTIAAQTAKAREAGLSAASEVEANAAATGAIGASAEAVAADIQQSVGEFEQSQEDARMLTNLNYNSSLVEAGFDTSARIVRPKHLNIPSDMTILGRAAATAAVSAGATYASSSMSLGLGKK